MMLRIYGVRIDDGIDENEFNDLLAMSSPSKREKITGFIKMSDRLRSLFSDLLARYIVSAQTGLRNEAIQFIYNKYGKPYVKGRQDCCFNVSYSGNWVVGALDNRPVGIDVEEMRDMDLDVSEYLFSFQERRDLKESDDKLGQFFAIWTLKESFSKFVGTGASLPFESISFDIKEAQQITVSLAGKPLQNVYFHFYNMDLGYKLALCAAHNRLPGRVIELSRERLVDGLVR